MTTTSLRERLETLLCEPLSAVQARQAQTLERLIGSLDQPFALFGASHLGRKAQLVLKDLGYTPCAFIDNNAAAWGTHIDGVPVMSPTQLAEQSAGALPAILCTIWSGHIHDRMEDRLQPLRELGFTRIALFGHLAWRYPQQLLPHYCMDLPEKVLPHAAQILQAFDLLADLESQQLFVDHVAWRLHLDHDVLPGSSPKQIYFDSHFCNDCADEVVFDLGAFNGDTLRGYLQSGRSYEAIHCFEPVTRNYTALQNTMQSLSLPNVYAHRLALGDRNAEVFIEAANGPSSRVGMGDESVPMTTIDDLVEQGIIPTFIKIDIEGFEPQCLSGGSQLISQQQPVIAVSVYHEQAHLWSILLQLHSYHAEYHFSLCPHVSEGWDLVLYAVPSHRLPSHLRLE